MIIIFTNGGILQGNNISICGEDLLVDDYRVCKISEIESIIAEMPNK